MKSYVGTKLLNAQPMTLGDYNLYRGWAQPDGEDPTAAGYLVEYFDGGEPNHSNHKGYISWSPADVFEAAYLGMPQDISGLPPHEQRVLGEMTQLSDKIEKLQAFFKGEVIKTLPWMDQQLLHIQHNSMMAYAGALLARVSSVE